MESIVSEFVPLYDDSFARAIEIGVEQTAARRAYGETTRTWFGWFFDASAKIDVDEPLTDESAQAKAEVFKAAFYARAGNKEVARRFAMALSRGGEIGLHARDFAITVSGNGLACDGKSYSRDVPAKPVKSGFAGWNSAVSAYAKRVRAAEIARADEIAKRTIAWNTARAIDHAIIDYQMREKPTHSILVVDVPTIPTVSSVQPSGTTDETTSKRARGHAMRM